MTERNMDCIILAAGRAKRLGKELPKQFLRLGGKPIFIHVVEAVEKSSLFDRVIITTLPEATALYQELLEQYGLTGQKLAPGGDTRQESVYLALKHVEADRVMIHEAARPFVTQQLFSDLMQENFPAVAPVAPIDGAIAVGDEFMTGILDRTTIREVQLPQMFDTEILRQAHEKAREDGFFANEDCMLVYRLGEKVRFIKGLTGNLKITHPFHLMVAERIIYDSGDE